MREAPQAIDETEAWDRGFLIAGPKTGVKTCQNMPKAGTVFRGLEEHTERETSAPLALRRKFGLPEGAEPIFASDWPKLRITAANARSIGRDNSSSRRSRPRRLGRQFLKSDEETTNAGKKKNGVGNSSLLASNRDNSGQYSRSVICFPYRRSDE